MAANYLYAVGYPKYLLALQPHLRTLTDLAKRRRDLMAAKLCAAWGSFLGKEGDFNGARAYSEQALEIFKQNSEQDQADYVNYLNNVAEICQVQGDITQAKYYAQQALEI